VLKATVSKLGAVPAADACGEDDPDLCIEQKSGGDAPVPAAEGGGSVVNRARHEGQAVQSPASGGGWGIGGTVARVGVPELLDSRQPQVGQTGLHAPLFA